MLYSASLVCSSVNAAVTSLAPVPFNFRDFTHHRKTTITVGERAAAS